MWGDSGDQPAVNGRYNLPRGIIQFITCMAIPPFDTESLVVGVYLDLGIPYIIYIYVCVILESILYMYTYIYIYMLPPLKSLPFLWVSSVQTAEIFLRWKTIQSKQFFLLGCSSWFQSQLFRRVEHMRQSMSVFTRSLCAA